MRIGIYNESSDGIGGSEYCAAVLGSALSAEHEVELIHHQSGPFAERLQQAFGDDLGRVSFRSIPVDRDWLGGGRSWTLGATRQWKATVSQGYDCLISICHWAPPFCQAKLGVLYVLFPTFNRAEQWPWAAETETSGKWRQFLRQRYYDWDWKQRLRSYSAVASISEFTLPTAPRLSMCCW